MDATKPRRIAAILACNGEAAARRLLVHRLRKLVASCPEESLAIVVADGGAPTGSEFEELSRGAPERWAMVSTAQASTNRSALLNLGARRALELQADYLCFIDTDVTLSSQLLDAVVAAARPRTFSIAGLLDDSDVGAATGFLALSTTDFERSAGFDELLGGWRCLEEIEYRLRLHVANQLEYEEIPVSVLGLDLADRKAGRDERSELMNVRARNRELIQGKLQQWVPQLRSRGPSFNDSTRARLLYQPSRSL